MIGSLDEAWAWYQSAKKTAEWMKRLGARHWEALPWEGPLGRDHHLNLLDAIEIEEKTSRVLGDLDDLCVLLLFSAFEATIRARVLRDVQAATPETDHPTIRSAWDSMEEGIQRGSFTRVLEPFKRVDATLIEEVNQVRKFRNWVAHGRRDEPPASVDPVAAFDRLSRFLTRIES